MPEDAGRVRIEVAFDGGQIMGALISVESADELRFSGLKRECGIHGLEG